MLPLLSGAGNANGVACGVPDIEVPVLLLLEGGDELVEVPFFAFPFGAFLGTIGQGSRYILKRCNNSN